MLLRIENTTRNHAWGRRGAIGGLLGRPASADAEAELWLGTHYRSPAVVVQDGRSLADVVQDFPFLLKVLAAASPLSLQAHPGAEQAREGFERENSMGIALDAPERNYRDAHPKPELIVAVSERFEALSGFRPAAEACVDLVRIASKTGSRETLAPLLDRLGDDASVGDALIWLLERGPEAEEVVAGVQRALLEHPDELPYASRIAAQYPGDPGIVGALLLHHVVLSPGEALYLPAGNIHAYLDGIGVELMAPSDNVLRGGLTPKHVDVPELARVLDRAARPIPRLRPITLDGGGLLYSPDDPEAAFSLALIDSTASLALAGPAIALCTGGAFTIRGAVSSIEVTRGNAILATPDEGALRIEGTGSLYLAR